jgi:hypothetical protein
MFHDRLLSVDDSTGLSRPQTPILTQNRRSRKFAHARFSFLSPILLVSSVSSG